MVVEPGHGVHTTAGTGGRDGLVDDAGVVESAVTATTSVMMTMQAAPVRRSRAGDGAGGCTEGMTGDGSSERPWWPRIVALAPPTAGG